MQTKKQIFMFAGLALLLATAGWYGCSDGTVSTVVSQDELASGGYANVYLPTAEGYTSVFNVVYSGGTEEMVTVRVGRSVQLGAVNAIEWIGTNQGVADTGYIAVTSDCVYFYETSASSPEKIIEMPMTTGQSWERFADSDIGDGDITDIITGNDKDDDTTATDDPSAKVFPSDGGNIMTVAGREQLELSSGLTFSDVVKVYNEGSVPNRTNYYWFVANVGLVKYVIGASDNGGSTGEIVGELLDYGY
ncbi:MAG: hypothetical protein JSW34_11480 [Candidatus Zixiibacteriota bacterium]|nr:MAG: hypothetical protein JSW34_11480 [candidate division Zixibacteria bacterium]